MSGCIAGLVLIQALRAQYPGQYPPGQYPPTYPPNTYPGGGYPPNTYPPNTYPGGRLPGGLPVPDIHLPKREPKQKTETTVSPVDGTLRKLGEKDLLLQTTPKRTLRFRVLAKTQFRDKQGQPIRDSLLHPGDQLTVQANPDDQETALRVIFLRSGTDAERAAAEKSVDEASVHTPSAEDFGKTRTVTENASAESQPEYETPGTTPPATVPSTSPPSTSPASEPTADRGPGGIPVEPRGSGPISDQQMIREAREMADTFTTGLPNYTVDQSTARYYSPSGPRGWQPIDVVTNEMAHVDGKEQYRNFKINGSPTDQPERSGAWSTGEFSTTLQDVLSVATNASFRRRGEARVAGRQCVVYDLTVDSASSHWTMVSPDGRQLNAAYEGGIWIDKETRRVLRIEQRTTGLPYDFPLARSESTLEYNLVKIEQHTYLLPASSEVIGCVRGSGTCTRNVIQFKNYRKFTADSNVKYN
jgi:hypothetical protein